MSQVLATVSKAGRKRSWWQSSWCSNPGCSGVEHIHNVIARLNQAPLPISVETTPQLTQAPIADTERYDTLRGTEVDHA
jgi:hypothetical protein